MHANGVEYVALPDARLDDSSLAERALIMSGLPYLHQVWRDAHWRVWKVDGFAGLVDGPATLRSMSPDRVTLAVTGSSDLVLRVRATKHWSVAPGGCAAATADGWTRLHGLPTGTVTLTQSLSGTPCPDGDVSSVRRVVDLGRALHRHREAEAVDRATAGRAQTVHEVGRDVDEVAG